MAATVWSNRPTLERPVLVAAFDGWNDAASAATAAVAWLRHRWHAVPVARIEGEAFTDYQGNRPLVTLRDGVVRDVEWPGTEVHATTDAGGGRGAVLLTGPEPNLRWRAYTDEILDLAAELGCELVVSLGALLADVPHTRPAVITGVTPDGRPLPGSSPSRYEGPTGIVGVLLDACHRRGVATASLWASVPHYVAGAPNPPATLALLDRLARLTGVTTHTAPLERTAAEWRRRVDAAVADDPERIDYVRRLEEAADEEEAEARRGIGHPSLGLDGEHLPSGDELAAELQRYLREREGEE
jgi:proteasome assembly chaperone (PAC2) family protein